jgi:hypothetical protein
VAAAILAAVEDGILPSGMATLSEESTVKPARESAGQDPSSVALPSPQLMVPDNPPGRTKSSVALRRVDARLYGRREARRYFKRMLGILPGGSRLVSGEVVDCSEFRSGRQDAALYGRRDARRYYRHVARGSHWQFT